MDWPMEAAVNLDLAWTAWIQDVADVVAWTIPLWIGFAALTFLIPLALAHTVRRHSFWCRDGRREVEVKFEERGLPGFRRALAVRACSRFDPPNAVCCRRRCLDPDFRSKWEPALPSATVAVGRIGARGRY